MINLQKTMENENDFRIRTYTKRELACLYCPNTTARCAIRTLTRWIKRNNELYAELLLTGYHARVRTFMPRQVGIIVRYLNNERGRNVPDVFLLVCSLAVFNGFHLYFSRSFCSFALVNKKKNQ